jgi:lysine-N-methylase
MLLSVGDHWRISLRFACPSVAANRGRPVADQLGAIAPMAEELAQRWGRREPLPPPRLRGQEQVSWDDLQHFVDAFVRLLQEEREPFARRLLKCLALVRLCRGATFEQVTGERLREFLDLVVPAVDAEVPHDWRSWPEPEWIGRLLFRTALSIYLRRDQGTHRGVRARGWWAWMAAAARLVRGNGAIPRFHAGLPETSFEALDTSAGPVAPEAERVLERYYLIKVQSLQFCMGFAFWEGFEALALTFPILCWLMRGFRTLGPEEAACRSLSIVDYHVGHNPALTQLPHRLALRLLVARRDLDRLIAWYAR